MNKENQFNKKYEDMSPEEKIKYLENSLFGGREWISKKIKSCNSIKEEPTNKEKTTIVYEM